MKMKKKTLLSLSAWFQKSLYMYTYRYIVTLHVSKKLKSKERCEYIYIDGKVGKGRKCEEFDEA